MNRIVCLLAVLPWCGCLGDAMSVDGGSDAAADFAAPPGGPCSPCHGACDCGPGLGCAPATMTCERVAAPLFCCVAPICPHGAVCQRPDGEVGQCGITPLPDMGKMMPPPDGGMEPKPCMTVQDCVGACPPGSLDCTCFQPPNLPTKVCAPTCNGDGDCPMLHLTCHGGVCGP